MTVARTTLLDLPIITTGTESGLWGDYTNNGLTQYLDIAIAGMSNLTSANFTAGALTIETTEGTNSATNIVATSAQYAGLRVSSLATNSTITVGNTGANPGRAYRLINADSTYTLTFKATGQTGVTLQPGQSAVVAFNGTDYVFVGVVLNAAQTFTAAQTVRAAPTQDGVALAGRAGGTSSYAVTITPTTLSANRTLTLPNVTDTVATIGTAQTFTAAQTFRAANAIRSEAASTQDAVVIAGRAGGTSSYAVTLTPTTLSASRTVTLPDADINFTTGLGVAQGGTGAATLTANNVILGNGTSAVQFVAPGTAGNVLVSDGTTWTSAASSGGLTLIATLSPTSGTSSITASSIAAYKVLYLVASPLSFSAQDNLVAYFSADNGSTYPNNILLSASGTAPNGILTIFGANLSVTKTMLQQQSNISGQILGGYITQVGPSAPINNIKVQLNSSTFSGSSNRIYIYGLN